MVKPGHPRVPTFSHDALQAASLWKINPYLSLTYNTPSKIPARMVAALKELMDEGIVQEKRTNLGVGYKLTYTASREALATVPRISLEDMERDPLPMSE